MGEDGLPVVGNWKRNYKEDTEFQRFVLIGDLHLGCQYHGWILDNLREVADIIEREYSDAIVVIMGDVVHSTRVSVSVIADVMYFIQSLVCEEIIVLQGNHDANQDGSSFIGCVSAMEYTEKGVPIRGLESPVRISMVGGNMGDSVLLLPYMYPIESMQEYPRLLEGQDTLVLGHVGVLGEVYDSIDLRNHDRVVIPGGKAYFGHIHKKMQGEVLNYIGGFLPTNRAEFKTDGSLEEYGIKVLNVGQKKAEVDTGTRFDVAINESIVKVNDYKVKEDFVNVVIEIVKGYTDDEVGGVVVVLDDGSKEDWDIPAVCQQLKKFGNVVYVGSGVSENGVVLSDLSFDNVGENAMSLYRLFVDMVEVNSKKYNTRAVEYVKVLLDN